MTAPSDASLRAVVADCLTGNAPEAEAKPPSWPQPCPCCEAPITREEWDRMKKVGYVGAFKAAGRYFCCELRNHECGSTLGIEVEVPLLKP